MSWALNMAKPKVITTAANAVPIRVPGTPSLEVKIASITEAIPAATVLCVSKYV